MSSLTIFLFRLQKISELLFAADMLLVSSEIWQKFTFTNHAWGPHHVGRTVVYVIYAYMNVYSSE